jgi:hypothetical protein
VQEHIDLGGFPVEPVLLIADGLDGLAGGGLELGRIDGVVAVLVFLDQRRRDADLSGDHHAVGGGQRFAGDTHTPWIHTGLLCLAIDQIDDLIRDAVAHLVGVSFRNGFACEQESRALHCRLHQIEVVENV